MPSSSSAPLEVTPPEQSVRCWPITRPGERSAKDERNEEARPAEPEENQDAFWCAGYEGRHWRQGHKVQGKVLMAKTPAWQRAEGKNPAGGLNAKGRASAKAGGHNLKPPVKSGDNPRRASFLARMGNMPGPEKDEKGRPTRLLKSLQVWGASSKSDAKAKAKAMSARLKTK